MRRRGRAPLAAWAVHNGVRYDDTTVARGGRAWVPFLQVFTANKTISPENGPASQRLADLIEEEVLSKDPHAGLDVTLDAYLQNGSNYETVRLIALSDWVLGHGENYDVLFDSALEAIREHPASTSVAWRTRSGSSSAEAAARGRRAARADRPRAPAPTFESDGVVLPNPQATVLLVGVPYGFVWCASEYIDSCTVEDPSEVWSNPTTQERYREIVAQVRAWDAELPSRDGVERRPGDSQPDHAALPDAVALARGRGRRARGPATARAGRRSCSSGELLPRSSIHAASQGVAPEFALPVYPAFIVGASLPSPVSAAIERSARRRGLSVRVVGVVLVHNEDVFVERAVRNVAAFCDRIHAFDHVSTDRTGEVLSDLARELDHVTVRRTNDARDSHRVLEPYAGSETWVLGVDGDELFDPEGLARIRQLLDDGAYADAFHVKAHVLNCTVLDDEHGPATGHMAPPSRPVTKLFNMAAVETWTGCPQRVHGGAPRFRPGFDWSSLRYVSEETEWSTRSASHAASVLPAAVERR